MKGFIVRMWPGDALPNSYFGLVRRLVDACPWLEVVKRSVCIEGDRGKGVPSFDEMTDIALVTVDFDDPTTNVRGRRALAIAKPTPRGC